LLNNLHDYVPPRANGEEESGLFRPEPRSVAETGLHEGVLRELLLKFVLRAGTATPRDMIETLRLPARVIEEILAPLKQERLLQINGAAANDAQSFRYVLTAAGHEQALLAAERNGYVGAAPIPWSVYLELQKQQTVRGVRIPRSIVQEALRSLVLPAPLLDAIGVAMNSSQSLLLSGAPGNGKTSITRAMREMLPGSVLVPWAVDIAGQTVSVYDPNIHERIPHDVLRADRRLVACKRPIVTVGGELTLEDLDLQWDAATHCYGAPPPLKANGGLLVVDDFGRQRVRPHELLNRWITPLEAGIDRLRLRSGGSVEVPFDSVVVFSSNRGPEDIGDEAFLRRIRYKLHVPNPTREEFIEILHRACVHAGVAPNPEAEAMLLRVYYEQAERPFRGCQPADLLGIVHDFAAFRGEAPRLDSEALCFAGNTYFGNATHKDAAPPPFGLSVEDLFRSPAQPE
jgi:predicted ATPase with chaperone activity